MSGCRTGWSIIFSRREARDVSPHFVYWGTKLACLEMMLSGTTTFVDMYYFLEDRVADAAKEAGMRGVLGETVIGFPSPDAKTPNDALARLERLLTRFKNDPLIVPAVAPHALYTNSPETLKAARALANRYEAPLLIHLAETKKENEDSRSKYGMSATKFLDSIGLFNGRTVAAHGVWLDADDIRILRERGAGVAHCPSSNMKLASGIAPVVKLLQARRARGPRHGRSGGEQQRFRSDGRDEPRGGLAESLDWRSASPAGETSHRDGDDSRRKSYRDGKRDRVA